MPAGGLSPRDTGPWLHLHPFAVETTVSIRTLAGTFHVHPPLPPTPCRQDRGSPGWDSHSVPVCSASRSPRHARGWGLSPRLQGGCWGGLCSACGSIPAAALGEIQGDVGRGVRRLRQRKHQCFCKCESVGRGRRSPKEAPWQEGGASWRRRCAAGAVRRAAPPPSSVPRCDDHGQGHAAQRDGRRTEEPLPGDGLKGERPAR